PLRCEAYGATSQGSHAFVTVGYGPTTGTGTATDFIAARFTADGRHDRTFGNNGTTYLDGEGVGDNGRAVVVLPDLQVLTIGGGRRNVTGQPADGMLGLLSEGGLPVSEFGAGGRRLYELGGAADFFWGGALSPDHSQIVVVGLGGANGATQGIVLRLPLVASA